MGGKPSKGTPADRRLRANRDQPTRQATTSRASSKGVPAIPAARRQAPPAGGKTRK